MRLEHCGGSLAWTVDASRLQYFTKPPTKNTAVLMMDHMENEQIECEFFSFLARLWGLSSLANSLFL